MELLNKIAGQWKSMPTWQKGITALGFLTVGVTITLTTTALVKKSYSFFQKDKTDELQATTLDKMLDTEYGPKNSLERNKAEAQIIDATQRLLAQPNDLTDAKKAI